MYKPTDRSVKIIAIACLCLYAAIFITGLVLQQLLLFIAVTNAVTGIIIITYWLCDKLRPLTRLTERREMMVLLTEALIVAISVYLFSAGPTAHWVIIIQYIIFTLHAILLLIFLIFIFTFKIKKLF